VPQTGGYRPGSTLRAQGIAPARPIPGLTGKVEHPDNNSIMVARACSACSITYYVLTKATAAEKKCPLCVARAENEAYRIDNENLRREIQIQNETNDRYRIQLSEVEAMQDALSVASRDDIAWLKSIIYAAQSDASVAMMAMPVDREGVRMAFSAVFRNPRRTEEYTPSSIGGVALAAAYDQATKRVGNVKALEQLTRALVSRLQTAVIK
jgi:hypothetical protein